AAEGHRLPELTTLWVPEVLRSEEAALRRRLLVDYGIEIGGGLGEFKGKAWRIGIMGYNSRAICVLSVLAALEQVLSGMGVKLKPGSGVAAAQAVYAA
ncbi:MAG: alanine--glyoxylate aminotransferase family protein, partial [Gemmata sp.]